MVAPKKVYRIASQVAESTLFVSHHVGFCSRAAGPFARPEGACSLAVLPGLLTSCFRPVGSPRSLLTGRRPVRMVSGTEGPARLETEGSASKDAEWSPDVITDRT